MSLKESLDSVVAGLDGVVKCSLMGTDGIEIATVGDGDAANAAYDPETLLVELTSIVKNVAGVGTVTGAGELSELLFTTDELCVIARILTQDYFVVLLMESDASIGKGRFLLRTTAPDLAAELM